MVIGGMHVSCKRFSEPKEVEVNFRQQRGPIGICPHPADVLIISSDDILTEDLQPTMACKVKTQKITDATNALTKTI